MSDLEKTVHRQNGQIQALTCLLRATLDLQGLSQEQRRTILVMVGRPEGTTKMAADSPGVRQPCVTNAESEIRKGWDSVVSEVLG